MSMKAEYTAHDMATAAADGFRDGQRAAQSAPAGAVLMPPQCTDRAQHVKYRNGWNSCLSEVARLNRVQSMPENWKPVPVKPTIEMVEAGYEASLGMPDRSGHARAIEMFDAMLAAAPAQPAAQGYVIVPVYPTPKMLSAYMETDGAVKRWKAMVAAAKAEGVHV